jgi:hypothetical protein
VAAIRKPGERIFWPSAAEPYRPLPAAPRSREADSPGPALFTRVFICRRQCMTICAEQRSRSGGKSIQLSWRGLNWRCKSGQGKSETFSTSGADFDGYEVPIGRTLLLLPVHAFSTVIIRGKKPSGFQWPAVWRNAEPLNRFVNGPRF